MAPSLATSTPGNFFKRSSTTAFSFTLIVEALNSKVSFLTTTGGISPLISTPVSVIPLSSMDRVPKLSPGFAELNSKSLFIDFKPK